MAWIEYHLSLREFWKVDRLAARLGIRYTEALGVVSCLWCWAGNNAKDGRLKKFTDLEIAKAARWEGPADNFKEILRSCRLLDKGTDKIHDWDKHGLRLIEESRRRQKEYRQRQKGEHETSRVA